MRHCVKEVDSLFHPKVRWGEDSIFNASAGVGGKACPTVRVESIHCFHQADGADGNKVVLIAGQGVVFFLRCVPPDADCAGSVFPVRQGHRHAVRKRLRFPPGQRGAAESCRFPDEAPEPETLWQKIAEEIKTCRPLPIVS